MVTKNLVTEDFTAADWADLKREEQAGQWWEHLDLPDDFEQDDDYEPEDDE